MLHEGHRYRPRCHDPLWPTTILRALLSKVTTEKRIFEQGDDMGPSGSVKATALALALVLGWVSAPGAQQEEATSRRAGATRADEKKRHILPPEAFSQALLTHDRNLKRAKPGGRKPKHKKDGDVAVVVDQGTIVTRARPENRMDLLSPVSIMFVPAGDGYAVSLSNDGPDVVGGEPLEIFDPAATAEIPLGFPFPFFGQSYTSAWINGAGNLTLGAPDTDPFDPDAFRDLPRFSAGPPRIAPLYGDLFPNGVLVETLSDRVVITWDLFGDGQGVQAVLRPDGSIRFVYPYAVDRDLGDAVVGLSPGETGATVQIVDYLSDLPSTFGRGVIAEAFAGTTHLFDLSLQSISFAPVTGGFAILREPAVFDPDLGPALEMGADNQAEVLLPFPFPFRGQEYTRALIDDDGFIQLGEPCSSQPSTLAGGPCVLAFARNLEPDQGGSIHAAVRGDRLVVTWSEVPSFGITVTVQATLHADGRVILSYPRAIPPARATVGLVGGGFSRPIRELDFSADLPVVVEAATVLERFGPFIEHFDLLDTNLTFTPEGGGFRTTRGRGGFDDAHHRLQDGIPVGCDLETPDCGSAEVALPFAFPFMGRTYDRFFVNPSGNITFDTPDPEDVNAARMLGGPPRITPMSFSGPQLGRVSAFADANGAVVTWDKASSGEVTMQLLLAPDGTIRFVYTSSPVFGLVGIAAGSNQGPVMEIDLSADRTEPVPAGIIFEEFARGVPFNSVDLLQLTQEFYAEHPDKYDVLVTFTDFPVGQGVGTDPFALDVYNATTGLGKPIVDNSSRFGSLGELESLVMMQNINAYWPDAYRMFNSPIDVDPVRGTRRRIMGLDNGVPWDIGLSSPVSTLTHEVGHRWLVHTRLMHPQTGAGADSLDLLGSQRAHWNAVVHTAVPRRQFPGEPRASTMEGNVIVDRGGPSFAAGSGLPDCRGGDHAFVTDPLELSDGFNEIDQYLMGLLSARHVGPFFYVDNATAPGGGRLPPSGLTVSGLAFCGTRVDLTLSNIIDHPEMGPRVPAFADENDDGRGKDVKTVAFVLLTLGDDHRDALKRVDTMRRVFEWYANGPATAGRGRFDTSLAPKIH